MLSSVEDLESFSIVERLADAIRSSDDVQTTPEDRARLVKDFYEGPRKCQCCVNWVEEIPANADLDVSDKDAESHPLILRRNVMLGEGRTQLSVHSIEVCNAEVREVLYDVFAGFDGIHPEVNYLILLAPFRQFFWRWDAFETAIEKQENHLVKSILLQLRAIVRRELADAFAVSKELTSHGVIAFEYLWTIFPPGEMIYSGPHDGGDRLYILESSRPRSGRVDLGQYAVTLRYVDWNGSEFGYSTITLFNRFFKGTMKITDLHAYPAKYHEDLEAVRARCLERGRKFRDLAGIQYKSYRASVKRHDGNDNGEAVDAPTPSKSLDRRIVLDARNSPSSRALGTLVAPDKAKLYTGLITQTPVDVDPPGGHEPLPLPPSANNNNNWGVPRAGRLQPDFNDDDYVIREGPVPRRDRYPIVRRGPQYRRSSDSLSSIASSMPLDLVVLCPVY